MSPPFNIPASNKKAISKEHKTVRTLTNRVNTRVVGNEYSNFLTKKPIPTHGIPIVKKFRCMNDTKCRSINHEYCPKNKFMKSPEIINNGIIFCALKCESIQNTNKVCTNALRYQNGTLTLTPIRIRFRQNDRL